MAGITGRKDYQTTYNCYALIHNNEKNDTTYSYNIIQLAGYGTTMAGKI